MWQLKKWIFRKVQVDDEEMTSKSPPTAADLDDSDSDFVPPVDGANDSSESSKADDGADDVAGNVHKKQKNKGQKQIKKIANEEKTTFRLVTDDSGLDDGANESESPESDVSIVVISSSSDDEEGEETKAKAVNHGGKEPIEHDDDDFVSQPTKMSNIFLETIDDQITPEPVDSDDPYSQQTRIKFLQSKFVDLEQLMSARKRMDLVIGQSDKKLRRYRFRVRGDPKQRKLVTFRYNVESLCYQRSQGSGAATLQTILTKWAKLTGTKVEEPEKEVKRRSNVVWTLAAAHCVMDMVDPSLPRRYTMTQIANVLNRPETDHIYKHECDSGRSFTKGNVQAFLRKVFPPERDTQDGVNLLGKLI